MPRKARQAGDLEQGHVPGAQHLARRSAERRGEDRRVRHVHDHQALQRADAVGGEGPGETRAPVVADQSDLACATDVDQGRHVLHQSLDAVAGHILRLGLGLAVAAQVGSPGAVAQLGQQRQLMTPREPALGKPVQAERKPAALARLVHGEIETVRLDAARGDGHGRSSA